MHLAILSYFAIIPDLQLLPSNPDFQAYAYTDQGQGGNSRITQQIQNDSIFRMDYVLQNGFANPYVGITVSTQSNQTFDLSAYNQLSIEVSSSHLKGIVITIFSKMPSISSVEVPSEMWHQKVIEFEEGKSRYIISFDQLKSPDWWVEQNHLSDQQIYSPNFSAVQNINIGTAYYENDESTASIGIKSLKISRNNSMLLVILFTTYISIILAWVIIYWFRHQKTPELVTPIKIEYQPVSTPAADQDLHSILQYINAHFHEAELTIEQVAEQTGYSTRRISGIIQTHVQSNFKTYLNSLRITESKRLLTETDLNIGEVAYKVGFSNQSHFNRVFKSMENQSPTQYKSATKS